MNFITEAVIVALIASLVSPAILKLVEFAFSKSSEKTRKAEQERKDMLQRIEALGKRVDELRAHNTEQMVKIGVQQATIDAQAKEISAMRDQLRDKDRRIEELETQVHELTMKRGSKR